MMETTTETSSSVGNGHPVPPNGGLPAGLATGVSPTLGATAPQWFVAVGGIIYITGFLVVIAHLDWFGVRESGSEFFKLKYFHVGILCLALPTIFLGLVQGFRLLALGRTPAIKLEQRRLSFRIPGILLTLNLLLVMYLVMMFAPSGFFRQRHFRFLLIFIVTMLGLVFSNEVFPKLAARLVDSVIRHWFQSSSVGSAEKRTFEEWVGSGPARNLKYVVLLVVILLDVYCLSGMEVTFWRIVYPRGFFYLLCVGLLVYTIARLVKRSELYTPDVGRTGLWVMGFAILAPLYFLSVIGFAYGIYPHIPVSRGGGNIGDAPPVVLSFRPGSVSGLPSELCAPGGTRSVLLVVIEEGAKALYVMRYDNYLQWRSNADEDSSRRLRMPTVWWVSREDILAVESNNQSRKDID